MRSRHSHLACLLASLLIGATSVQASTTQRTVAVGALHACAITQPGGLKCWGANDFGQLGDGSTTPSALPVDVVGLDHGVIAVSASYYHTCALVSGGALYCWGSNAEGQLGDGTGADRSRPVPVAGLSSGVKIVTTGYKHTCALMQDGSALCWGLNDNGQLGDGTLLDRRQPVRVAVLPSGQVDIEAAERNTCVLTAEGNVACWGLEGYDHTCWEEGWYCTFISCGPWTFCSRTPRYRTSPRLDMLIDYGVASIDMATSGSGGSTTWGPLCVLTAEGNVRCSDVYLNNNTPVSGATPGTTRISVGGESTCVTDSADEVGCWGYNVHGELGVRSGTDNWYPPPAGKVSGVPKGVVEIAAGIRSICVRTNAGDVYCWGDNSYGQLGDGTWQSVVGKVVKVAAVSGTPNYTDLWWNPSEPGWGIGLNHQGSTIFATLFNYDASGAPLWLFMSNGDRQPDGSFLGALHRSSGPPFNAYPWTPNTTRVVGNMRLTFTSENAATLAYSFDGINVTKSIRRFAFSRPTTCDWTESDRSTAANYQDLWWNPTEPGWGVSVAHQGDILFAALYTYDPAGNALWLSMSSGLLSGTGTYSGSLYHSVGPPFSASPWGAYQPSPVGSMTFNFHDGNTGTLSYSVDGIQVVKSIRRFVFSTPKPHCIS